MLQATQRSAPGSDDVRMFRRTASQFIQREFAPHHARWCLQRGPDAAAWTKAGAAGLLLPDIPQEYGGGGGTFAHEAVVLEELARAGVQFGAAVQSIVAHYLLAYGSEEQKRGWLPRMARGELVGAIAMSEPGAGSDLQGIKTTARRDGDHYVINGSKTFVTNGAHAGILCLAVKTDTKVGRLERHLPGDRRDARPAPATRSAARWRRSACTRRTPASSSSTTCASRSPTSSGPPKARASRR